MHSAIDHFASRTHVPLGNSLITRLNAAMASFQASLVWWICPTVVSAWPALGCRGKLSTNVSRT